MFENHFCKSGAVVEAIKKGRPAALNKERNSQKVGFDSVGRDRTALSEMPMGRNNPAIRSSVK